MSTTSQEKAVSKNRNVEQEISPIAGFVEAVIKNTVHGWINYSNLAPIIEILLDDRVIGRGEATNERKDLSASPHAAKGFSIKTEIDIAPEKLVDKRLRVVAIFNDKSIELLTWPPLLEAGRFCRIDFEKIKNSWNSIPPEIRQAANHAISPFTGRAFKRVSSDGVVQVGRNGFYFLANGSNYLEKFYSGEIEIDTDRWTQCFRSRQQLVEALGSKFVQVVIPEKSSVIPEYAPFTAAPGSASYLKLVRQCADAEISLFDILSEILESNGRLSFFPQVDTHFNTDGAEFFTRSFLRYIGAEAFYNQPEKEWLLIGGDLCSRFNADGDINELVSYYPTLQHNETRLTPTLTSHFDPPSGHQGRRRRWKNVNAPIDKKVVCFGNSFFERGETSRTLSWWFSHLFSEFHFIWSANMDLEYIKKIKPDIVVCQTIERFLTAVPSF